MGVVNVVFGELDAVTLGGVRAGGLTFSNEGFCRTRDTKVNK